MQASDEVRALGYVEAASREPSPNISRVEQAGCHPGVDFAGLPTTRAAIEARGVRVVLSRAAVARQKNQPRCRLAGHDRAVVCKQNRHVSWRS